MVEKLKNRIKQTCTGSGTGALNIANGTAPAGFKKVISLGGFQVSDKGIFCLESKGQFEIFRGTITDSDTLSRGTVDDLIESSTGSRLDLDPTVTHTVFCDLDANGYVYVDSTGKAAPGKSILRGSAVDIVSDLTSIAGGLSADDEGAVYLVHGGAQVNDGRGGFYRWSGTAFERVYLRKLLKFGTFESGEATQDVANIDALVTAGSEPLTDFINGTVGQTITIFRGASDINLVNSSLLKLGGSDFTLNEKNPSVTLTRITNSGDHWVISGRSDNRLNNGGNAADVLSSNTLTVKPGYYYQLAASQSIEEIVGLGIGESCVLLPPVTGTATLVHDETPSSGQAFDLDLDLDFQFIAGFTSPVTLLRVADKIRIFGGGGGGGDSEITQSTKQVTYANLIDVTHSINTSALKKLGFFVLDTTNNRIYFALGSDDNSKWRPLDDMSGVSDVTPE